MRRYLCPQFQTHGCGIACVKTAIGLLRQDPTYVFAEEIDAENSPPNLEELIAYARLFGAELEAYRIPSGELLFAEKTPLLLVYRLRGKAHMRLLLRVGRKRFWIYDPDNGVKKMKKGEALEGFTGIFLEIVRLEKRNKEKPRRLMPFGASFFPRLASLLAISFFVAGSLTLGSTLPSFLPLCFLGMGALWTMLYCACSSWGMRRFDEAFSGRLPDIDPERRKEKFRLFHAYKQRVFGRGSSSLFPLLLSLSMACALAFRDFALGITFLIGLGLLIVSWASDVPRAERKKAEIVRLETTIMDKRKDDDDKAVQIETCLEKAREYSRYYLLRGALMFLFAALLSLMSLSLQNRLTFDSFIYYFFPVFFFMEQVDGSYAGYRRKAEDKRLKNRFVARFVLGQANTRTQEAQNGLQ